MLTDDVVYDALAFALIDGQLVILIMREDDRPRKLEIPLMVLTEAVKELVFNAFKN